MSTATVSGSAVMPQGKILDGRKKNRAIPLMDRDVPVVRRIRHRGLVLFLMNGRKLWGKLCPAVTEVPCPSLTDAVSIPVTMNAEPPVSIVIRKADAARLEGRLPEGVSFGAKKVGIITRVTLEGPQSLVQSVVDSLPQGK